MSTLVQPSTETTTERKFGMVQSGKGFRILSSTLYSDKAFAMIREILSNADDAHNAIGKRDVPFYLHLPSTAEPFLAVRDVGPGLSDEDMGRIYTVYFESTKARHSKNFAGQLGLGTKAPLAFTESFVVTSFYNGMKRAYTIFFDAEDNPTLSPPVVASTDEPNGIEVLVKIEPEDFKEINDKVASALTYYDPMPIISNAPKGFSAGKPDTVFTGENFALTMRGRGSNNHRYSYSSHPARAVMGRVIYPIKADMVPGLTDIQTYLLTLPFDIQFPLGALDFVPSREALSYDKVKTIPGIKKALKKLEEEIVTSLSLALAPCMTEFAARRKFGELDKTMQEIAQKLGGIPWGDMRIAERHFPIAITSGVTAYTYEGASRGVSRSHLASGHILNIPLDSAIVFNNDRAKSSVHGIHQYARGRLENRSNVKFILLEGDEAKRAAILKRISGVSVEQASHYIEEVVRKPISVKRIYNGRINKENLWATSVDMNEGGFYVLIANNEISPSLPYTADQWERVWKVAREFKLVTDEEIVAVPASLASKFTGHAKWKDFYEAMKGRAIQRIRQTKPGQAMANLDALEELTYGSEDRYGSRFDGTRVLSKLAEYLSKDHPVSRFVNLIEATKGNGEGPAWEARNLVGTFKLDMTLPPAEHNFNALWKALEQRYPMVTLPMELGVNVYDDEKCEKVFPKLRDYVGLVDAQTVIPLPVVAPAVPLVARRRRA